MISNESRKNWKTTKNITSGNFVHSYSNQILPRTFNVFNEMF